MMPSPSSGITGGSMKSIKLPSGIVVNMGTVIQFSRSAATITFTFTDSTTLAEVFASNANAIAALELIQGFMSGTSTALFPIPDPPAWAITSTSPNNGSHLGGDTIDVIGTGLQPWHAISFDTSPVTSQTWIDSTKITVVTPAHAAGAVTVYAYDGSSSVNLAAGYTYT